MKKFGLWEIRNFQPVRAKQGSIKLEKHLEEWIEQNPELLQVGLSIIGKQVRVEAGKIDVLGIDPMGRLAVIEIKKGTLHRETIAQGLDYVECITSMHAEELENKCDQYLGKAGESLRKILGKLDAMHQLDNERRDVLLYIVGTDRSQRLDKIVSFLSKSVPIFIVTFEVFTLDDGQHLLARELSEADAVSEMPKREDNDAALEALSKEADAHGIGKDFRRLCQAGLSFGLYPRIWKTSVMFTPPQLHNRMVFTVWTKPSRKKLKVFVSPGVMEEFFPISESAARKYIGEHGWRELDSKEVTELIKSYKSMFESFLESEE